MEAVYHVCISTVSGINYILANALMKFLIAIGSKEYSEPTLELGMRVAKAFNAGVTIVYVGEKISAFSTSEVQLAQENLENWELDRQGVDVLEWAYEYLINHDYITSSGDIEGFTGEKLVQIDDDRCEVYLEGNHTQEVGLILRNGDIINQLRDEVKRGEFDVTIIGASKKRRMIHDLIQYIDSSIFVVKNYQREKHYKMLLAVNDAPNTKKAVKYGVRVAQSFDLYTTAVTISSTADFREDYKKASAWADKFLRRSGVEYETRLEHGKFTETMNAIATDNHIIVMGSSTKSPLVKFFKGSKPLKVCEECNCPALIVK
ncbi:MAG TPA: universal stress protein [Candidatus Marinimicrobia bacterium]|jgi:nucleotide-binding universal stress UspA family protein|nr:universal stress protein [Candidatus Neomarinimicrobiota bacterium]